MGEVKLSFIESQVQSINNLCIIEYEINGVRVALSDSIFFQSKDDLINLKNKIKYLLSLVNNSIYTDKYHPILVENFNANRTCEMYVGEYCKYDPNKNIKKNIEEIIPIDGYVYLMHDRSSNCYKIGFSKTPEIRERTLQSECISIKMIHLFKGSRKDESNLHKIYKNYRVRGEWFRFPDDILYEVIDYYLSKK